MATTQTLQYQEELTKVEPVYTLSGQEMKKLFYASLVWLKNHQQIINSLNVFPVPDGDTGTNMFLTMQSAYNEITNNSDDNAGKIIHAIAQGALMGARGNSGVILSQLFRGFARVMDEESAMNADLFVKALAESRNTAYKGVIRPVEGTILTVAKDMAKAAESSRAKSNDILVILNDVVNAANESVKNTPNLLPILKQAGVVDSGGKGLFVLFEGMYRFATKKSLDVDEIKPVEGSIDFDAIRLDEIHDEIEPGQDFEIVVDFTPVQEMNLESLYDELSDIGTSIQVGEGDGLFRMHIHVPTEKKYEPIDLVSKFGVVKKVYIENLQDQVETLSKEEDFSNPIESNQIALIAVSPGKGISRIFKSLGAARIVSGGQTMNPSTNDIFESFKDLPTDNIIILPNNKNIIMAAESTKKLSKKKVAVIPTTNIPQGMVACLNLNVNGNYQETIETMNKSIDDVDAGELTIATRSIEINGIKVKEGEVIALLNGNLVASSNSILDACIALLDKADTKNREHITIFYGENASKETVDEVVKRIEEKYSDHEIEIHNGGQPHYYLIISIE